MYTPDSSREKVKGRYLNAVLWFPFPHSKNECVRVNFGQTQFVFDLQVSVRACFLARSQTTSSVP